MQVSRLMALAQETARRVVERRGARSLFVDVAGMRMHYLDLAGRSDGPTMVLVHGLGGSSLGWCRVLFRLARGARRVVAVDLPGSGFSPEPKEGPLGLDGLLASFESFAAQEVPERAVFIGQSLGGALVARFAGRHPEKILGLVLVCPAGGRADPARIREVVESYRVTTHREARELVGRLFARPPRILSFVLGPMLVPLLRRDSVQRLLRDALHTTALEDAELQALPPPVLLLWAKNERILPYESIEHFRTHLPEQSQIEEIDDFGHSPQLDRPGRLAELILRFVGARVPCNLGS